MCIYKLRPGVMAASQAYAINHEEGKRPEDKGESGPATRGTAGATLGARI